MHDKPSHQSQRSHEGLKFGAKTALRLGDDVLANKQAPFISISMLHKPSAFSSALSTNVSIRRTIVNDADHLSNYERLSLNEF